VRQGRSHAKGDSIGALDAGTGRSMATRVWSGERGSAPDGTPQSILSDLIAPTLLTALKSHR